MAMTPCGMNGFRYHIWVTAAVRKAPSRYGVSIILIRPKLHATCDGRVLWLRYRSPPPTAELPSFLITGDRVARGNRHTYTNALPKTPTKPMSRDTPISRVTMRGTPLAVSTAVSAVATFLAYNGDKIPFKISRGKLIFIPAEFDEIGDSAKQW